jgi:hypothetical protein
MNLADLIEQLEQQFGNQYAPKRYLIIQEAIEVLKLQSEEIKRLSIKAGESV